MPGPFPGVDPYLESPLYWRGFHNSLVVYVREALNAALPPGYTADSDERVYIVPGSQAVLPDVAVSQRLAEERRRYEAGGTAVLEADARPDGELLALPVEEREAFVEIRSGAEWEQVVAILEVLSPANKTPGEGRSQYLAKQAAVLASETHLMEIDLLRQGLHTVAAPVEALRAHEGWGGVVSLHRTTRRHKYAYWSVGLRRRLPKVRVPLSGETPDVILDLQACYDRTYDSGAYPRRVRYDRPPEVALSDDDAAWADALLHEKGLRTG